MRVISLSRGSVPCEFATRLAVDAGITVVKVEAEGGDPLRARPGHLFSYLAAGKQSVAVADRDLTSTLILLLSQSDAVVADEWGRDLMDAIPRSAPLVVVGERDGTALQGMLRDRSDEFLAFHGTGLGYITPRVMPGYPSHEPLCPDAHLVEFLAGLYGAIALFAMLGRESDAQAENPATATVGITAAALPLLRREVAAVLYEGAKPHRSERIWKVSPAEVHRCQDGWVFVDVIEDVQWRRLCEYMGRPELAADEHYATREKRFARAESLCAILDVFFATRSKSCWIEAQARGVPVAPVNSLEDLLHDPQLEARNFWTRIAAADGSILTAPSTPLARLFRSDVELTHVWSGPMCGQILADLGAEVIRIETRSRLDIHRRGGPYPDGQPGVNRSGTWNAQNRGKLGCTLDLKTSEGKELLLALVRKSDVIIENFTPDTLDRLGFGFAQLRDANPRIVLLSLSGYGHTGPHRDSLAYGPMMDAATGLSAATTYADGIPRAVNGWAADVGGALYGCAAILRILLEENHTARHLDISQFESGTLFVTEGLLEKANGGTARVGEVGRGFALAVPTVDAERWLAIAPRTLEEIQALCDLTGGAATTLRVVRSLHAKALDEARTEVEQTVRTWAATHTLDDAFAAMQRAGVPAAPIVTVQDLLADDHLEARGAWIEVEHPETGRTRSYGPAIRLNDAAPAPRPAPLLGGDNEYVIGHILGLSRERMRDLAERNVL